MAMRVSVPEVARPRGREGHGRRGPPACPVTPKLHAPHARPAGAARSVVVMSRPAALGDRRWLGPQAQPELRIGRPTPDSAASWRRALVLRPPAGASSRRRRGAPRTLAERSRVIPIGAMKPGTGTDPGCAAASRRPVVVPMSASRLVSSCAVSRCRRKQKGACALQCLSTGPLVAGRLPQRFEDQEHLHEHPPAARRSSNLTGATLAPARLGRSRPCARWHGFRS